MLSNYMCQPTLHYDELAAAHEALLGSRDAVLVRLAGCPSLPKGHSRYVRDMVRIRLEVTLALVVSLCLVVNRILEAFPWHDPMIYDARKELIQEALEAGDRALYARPLGASHAPAMVSIVFSIAKDMDTRNKARVVLRELCIDFPRLDPLEDGNLWLWKFTTMQSQVSAALGIAAPSSQNMAEELALEFRDIECRPQ